MIRRAAHQQGFTLLEILVAIAIFSVIGIASYQVLSGVKEADKKAEEHAKALEALQRAHWVMERDFMQMSIRQVRIDEEAPSKRLLLSGKNLLESDSEAISFTRNGWTNPFGLLPRGNVQGVAYRLREGKLERLYTLYPDAVQGTKPKVRVLLEQIDELEFRFLANKTWQDDWTKENQLPKAIEVTIKSDFNGDLRWVFLTTGAELVQPKASS